MLHKKCLLLLFVLTVLLPHGGNAVTISGVLGLGSSTTSNEISESEGPLIQSYAVEKLLNSNFAIGVEHIRSLSASLSTAISLTGLMTRYYINSAPTPYYKVEELSTSYLSYRDLSYFVAAGFGFAQSSRLPDEFGKTSNAAALYFSPHAGFDYQLTRSFGLRSELLMALTLMGKGSISVMSLGAGVYFLF